MPFISIIIPTLNESGSIGNLISYLLKNTNDNSAEILVIDGGSTDDTMVIASKYDVTSVLAPSRGRAFQMNFGASLAKGDIFYFIHADTLPPVNFVKDIIASIDQKFLIGRYQTRFNSNNWMLKLNAFFTRFDWFMCYGGDQTLFISRKLFYEINGFNERMEVMEDYDIVERAKKVAKYKILPGRALVSARKYETNNWITVQKANLAIVKLYKKKAPQKKMVETYKRMLTYR